MSLLLFPILLVSQSYSHSRYHFSDISTNNFCMVLCIVLIQVTNVSVSVLVFMALNCRLLIKQHITAGELTKLNAYICKWHTRTYEWSCFLAFDSI